MRAEGNVPGAMGAVSDEDHRKSVRRALERRKRAASAPCGRGWYKKKHKTITKGQRAVIRKNWERFGLDLAFNTTLDLESLVAGLGRAASGAVGPRQVILNVGFGKGEDLVHMSGAMLSCLFLGIEIHRASIACALASLEEADRRNVRVLRADATKLLQDHVPPACLDQVWVFFPDPWLNPSDVHRRVLRLCPSRCLARFYSPLRILCSFARFTIFSAASERSRHHHRQSDDVIILVEDRIRTLCLFIDLLEFMPAFARVGMAIF
jgi:tRNA G46 methylase TrmB